MRSDHSDSEDLMAHLLEVKSSPFNLSDFVM